MVRHQRFHRWGVESFLCGHGSSRMDSRAKICQVALKEGARSRTEWTSRGMDD